MNFKENKTIIVTGGANGIGRCIVETYAAANYNTVIADIDKTNGQLLEKEIRSKSFEAYFIPTDVSKYDDIQNLVNHTIRKYGNIDFLINNAGISRSASAYLLTVDEWDYMLNTNLRAMFLLTREAAKFMRQKGGGSVVNIASTRAFQSEPGWEAYAASKGGIIALTHAMAASFAHDKIRVNCISPGWIETGDYTKLTKNDHEQHFAGRVGKPEDIANACMFLTDEKNSFITGTNITIDGGMTKKMIYV
jgi:NAD(P)-dependent dehydrogenase (short-subunit alcohol dehydrogenase family)